MAQFDGQMAPAFRVRVAAHRSLTAGVRRQCAALLDGEPRTPAAAPHRPSRTRQSLNSSSK